jgi:hypothetical protein
VKDIARLRKEHEAELSLVRERYQAEDDVLEAALAWLEEADAQQYEPGPELPEERRLYLAAQELRRLGLVQARSLGQKSEE